jgi:glutamine amidotransferase
MRVALLDYGVGNLHSLAKALELGGARVQIEPDPLRALGADAIVLPGVGAFPAAAAGLSAAAAPLRQALQQGVPCLGICLGMQLLFEGSEEGPGPGIGLFPGVVRRLQARRVPHMGWNAVEALPDPLFEGHPSMLAYYANSYAVAPEDDGTVIATTEYGGERFAAAVRRGRTWGVQFHPEKSADAGLALIRNFLRAAGHR